MADNKGRNTRRGRSSGSADGRFLAMAEILSRMSKEEIDQLLSNNYLAQDFKFKIGKHIDEVDHTVNVRVLRSFARKTLKPGVMIRGAAYASRKGLAKKKRRIVASAPRRTSLLRELLSKIEVNRIKLTPTREAVIMAEAGNKGVVEAKAWSIKNEHNLVSIKGDKVVRLSLDGTEVIEVISEVEKVVAKKEFKKGDTFTIPAARA